VTEDCDKSLTPIHIALLKPEEAMKALWKDIERVHDQAGGVVGGGWELEL